MNSIVRPFLMKFLVRKEICESHRRQKCATKKGILDSQKKKKKKGILSQRLLWCSTAQFYYCCQNRVGHVASTRWLHRTWGTCWVPYEGSEFFLFFGRNEGSELGPSFLPSKFVEGMDLHSIAIVWALRYFPRNVGFLFHYLI